MTNSARDRETARSNFWSVWTVDRQIPLRGQEREVHQGRYENEQEQDQEQIIPATDKRRGEQQTPSGDRFRNRGWIDSLQAPRAAARMPRDRGINATGARSTVLAGYQIEEHMWVRGAR